MQQWSSLDVALTKRHLGLLLLIGGGLMIAAVIGMEILRPGGFGMLQKLGAALGVISVVVGLTLLPLGDQAA